MSITWEDIILETLPFRQEILDWCKAHPEFQKGLKALASERFLHLGVVIISYPVGTNDEVLGIYAYDYKNNPSLFKQDFIVDVDGKHKEFILYTGFPDKGTQNSKYVKHINNFLSKYGKNRAYAGTHHLTFEELPADSEIRKRAKKMIQRAKDLPEDVTHPPQQMLEDYLIKIKEAKRNGFTNTRKLDGSLD
ncbi:MAG TPA: hypothetical protein VLE91_02715 [Candidatus Saccharimonadales bacterium]|nr:hypothetical protein [Candidatus Saccharimonadales bacterium]